MNKPFYIFLFLFVFCCEAKTQTNLVPNGSFEEFDNCPVSFFNLNGFCKNWFDPTNCSSDYFQSCSVNVGTPNNDLGTQIANDGSAYVGLYTFYNGLGIYRESVCTKLIEQLVKNKKYCLKMFISLADSMCYATNNIDVSFSDNLYSDTICDFNPLNLTATASFNVSNYFKNKTEWIKLETSFFAKGNENYIYISNLRTNNDTLYVGNCNVLNQNFRGAYYFIDNISLIECVDSHTIPNVFTPNNDGSNDAWEFDLSESAICQIYTRWGNLIFETNKNIVKWDGRTTSGIECSEDTYFYIIQTERERYKGFIQLIR